MAGTRLWVQFIFVFEFFISLFVAVYIGILHNNKYEEDPLSIILFPPPGRSFLKNHALQHDSEESSFFPHVNQLNLPSPSVAIATTGSALALWVKALEKIKLPQDFIIINPKINSNRKEQQQKIANDDDDDSTLLSLCQDPSLLLQQQDTVDLYICDFHNDDKDTKMQNYDQVNNSRVVVKSGKMFFYPPSHSLSSLDDDSSSQQQKQQRFAEAVLNSIYSNHRQQQESQDAAAAAPSASSSCHHDIPIHFKFLLDMTTTTTNQDWKVWMDALNIALLKRQQQEDEHARLVVGHSLLLPFISSRRPRLTLSVETTVSNIVAAATRRETITIKSDGRLEQSSKENDNKDDDNEGSESSSSSWNQTTAIMSSTIRHEITLDQLVQSITDNGLLSSVASKHVHDDDDDPFIAYFYISNLPEPLVVVEVVDQDNDDDKEHVFTTAHSRTVALSHRVIFRILDTAAIVHAQQQQNNDNNNDSGDEEYRVLLQKEAALALDQVIDFMTRSCLGIPDATTTTTTTTTTTAAPLWDTDGSFPQFHETLFFQRAVQELYQKAVTDVQTQRNLVLTSSNRVPIREHHISVWQGAVDNIFKAIHLLTELQQQNDEMKNETKTSSHESIMIMKRSRKRRRMEMEVLDCLQQAIRLMEQMRANPDFIDRIDFPLEQYAAIFAPLALPLAIPLLVGLIREFKRYREKQTKKKASSSLAATTITTTAQSSSNDSNIKQD